MNIVNNQDNILQLHPDDKFAYLQNFKNIFKIEEKREKGWIEWFNSFDDYFNEINKPKILKYSVNQKNYQSELFSGLIKNSINMCNQMNQTITLEDVKKYGATIYYSDYDVKKDNYFEDLNIFKVEDGHICLYCVQKDQTLNANLVARIFPVNTSYSLLPCSSPLEIDFPINDDKCLVLTEGPHYEIQKITGYGRMKLIWVFLYNK